MKHAFKLALNDPNKDVPQHGEAADPTGQGDRKKSQNHIAWSALDNAGPNKTVIINNAVQTCCIL